MLAQSVKKSFSPFGSSNGQDNEEQLTDNGFKLISIEKYAGRGGGQERLVEMERQFELQLIDCSTPEG